MTIQIDHPIVIGYASNPKKRKQFFEPFAEHCRINHGVICVDILEQESLPAIDVLFLKITDDMNSRDTDKESADRLSRVEAFIEKHRDNVLVVEDLHKVERLLDRSSMYQFLHEALRQENLTGELDTPPFAVIGNASSQLSDHDHKIIRDLPYPVMCKTKVACGTSESHDMAIVFNKDQMTQLVEEQLTMKMELPIIAQQFVNHDATLHKIYVIADTTFVQQRPSIRNFDTTNLKETENPRFFNSHHPFASDLTDVTVQRSKGFVTNNQRFKDISNNLRKAMKIDLFGYDCVIDNKSNKCLIVDVNYLPGYSGVDNLFDRLLLHLQQRVEAHRMPNK